MKSVLRNVPGQASGCTAQMTVRESLAEGSREPRSTPPALWLSSLSLPSFPFRLPSVRLCLWHQQQPACLPRKTLRNGGGAVMGKQAYVSLAQHGKQQNPFLHISAAGGKSAAKSLPSSPAWVHSAVSTLNSEKPPDSKSK